MKTKVRRKKDLKFDLDELERALDQLPPRPVPLDAADAAKNEVMYRLRDELKESVAELKSIQAGKAPKKWPPLDYVELWAVTAVHLLDGNGTSIAVADKVSDLAYQTVRYFQVTEAMLALSKRGLIQSDAVAPVEESDCDIGRFTLTPEGMTILSVNREDSGRMVQALAGLPDMGKKDGSPFSQTHLVHADPSVQQPLQQRQLEGRGFRSRSPIRGNRSCSPV